MCLFYKWQVSSITSNIHKRAACMTEAGVQMEIWCAHVVSNEGGGGGEAGKIIAQL